MSLPPGLISGLPMQINPEALAIQQILQQQLAVQQLLRTQQTLPQVIPQAGGLPLSLPMMIPKLQNGPSRAPDGPPRRYQGSYEVKTFTYRSPHDGNGVVYSLGLDKKGGNWKNPVESRILRVCASSLSAGTLACTVDHDLNGVLFQSDDQPWSWCIFDFQECSIRPNYYTMAHRSMSHNFFIRSWQLEGSNDNYTWQILSRHNNDETITPNSLVGGWALHAKAFYRYLRIVLDPRGNSEGGSALLFNCFDVYGEFKYPSSGIPTPQSRPKDEKDRKRGGSRESSRERKRDRDSSERSRKKTFGGDDEMNNKDDDLRGVASVDLLTLRGQLMDHCLSQDGSRQVQARLSRGECTKEEMALLMEEISNSLLTLMENKFGNYVIQKLLEHGTTEYKTIITEVIRGNVLKLASQLFGCFVLQTALDVLDEDQALLIAEELRDHVLQSVDHHHANHVLRKCIEVLPPAKCKFLLDPLVGNVTEVAQHVYGCRLLQVVLARFSENSHLIPKLIEELVEGCRQLARDTYGNYVIQHVLTYGDKYYKSNVFQSLLGRITDLLQHQSASHVIEKMYEHANKDERADILDKLLIEEASQLPMLMKDKHANHVFQRMIDFSNSDEKSKIKDAMSPHQDVLSEEPHGRYLLLRLQGKWQGNKNTQAEGWNNKQATRGDNKRKRESNYEGYDPNEL